jgi:hypothetical protein
VDEVLEMRLLHSPDLLVEGDQAWRLAPWREAEPGLDNSLCSVSPSAQLTCKNTADFYWSA